MISSLYNLAGPDFIIMLVMLAVWGFWIWMIVDCATNESLRGTEKIVWLLIVILLHALGALIYFLAGRKKGAAA
jgi:Phospholipase_D-nuclease N-terminal